MIKRKTKYGRYQVEVWRTDDEELMFRCGTDQRERAEELAAQLAKPYPAPEHRIALIDTRPDDEDWN